MGPRTRAPFRHISRAPTQSCTKAHALRVSAKNCLNRDTAVETSRAVSGLEKSPRCGGVWGGVVGWVCESGGGGWKKGEKDKKRKCEEEHPGQW